MGIVVLDEVLVNGAQQNHGHHATQKEHNDQWVQYAEPLDFGVWHRVQYVIPTGGPLDLVIFRVFDRIGVLDLKVAVGGRHLSLKLRVAAALRVVNTLYWHLGVDDAAAFLQKLAAPFLILTIAVRDLKVEMIEQIVRVGFVEFLIK